MRIGGNSGIRRGRRDWNGFGFCCGLDTLDVDYDVVRVLGDDDSEAGGFGVVGVRVRRDCLHSDNKMLAFAIDDWVSPSEMRVAATSSEVV